MKPYDTVYVMDFKINDEIVNTRAIFIREQQGGIYHGELLVQINGVRLHLPKNKVLTQNEFNAEMNKRNKGEI